MTLASTVGQRADLTFRHNVGRGRHGWLRLTPAYSVRLVEAIFEENSSCKRVVDPFSGTGTTGLVVAERGGACDLLEINPFLVWLAKVKTRNYSEMDCAEALRLAVVIKTAALADSQEDLWTPPIHNIARWWNPGRLRALAAIHAGIRAHEATVKTEIVDLLRIAFCRALIEWSNAAFNHQSMSFKDEPSQRAITGDIEAIGESFQETVRNICSDARTPLRGQVAVFREDSRALREASGGQYNLLMTSPPYPNRISYIRELRPYMYWLGYLTSARQSGEMDWESIGGTWGIATSRLLDWSPKGYWGRNPVLLVIVRKIAERSPVLANYVHKYFEDMFEHFGNIRRVLAPGARAYYVVGNSKFYDTVLPTEELYGTLMRMNGFSDVSVDVTRKRNSKKELYEYVVSGTFKG